ncbi:unannotated protein [freshwater metagenome]|uniref:Unannotated protein n=1 Tax=freshwater metagenome TaxID=449393 RepID=A0A6J7H8J7_9ZZZZ|nr:hypothetical protein [Actinomycetota bacterium]
MTSDELLDALQDAWLGRRRSAFRDVCAPDIHWEDPFAAEPLYGPQALGDHAARVWEAFPDARIEPSGERLASGRFVAAPVRVTGTHGGALAGIPASGRSLDLHAVLYCELDPPGQRLWRVRVFIDAYEAAVQIGLLPRRGSLGERAMLMVRGFGLRRGGVPDVEGGPPARTDPPNG